MTDKTKEALKLALEALEVGWSPTYVNGVDAKEKGMKAITALRQAIEQEQPVGYVAELVNALYENGDPVSVDAAEFLEKHTAPPPSLPLTDEQEYEAIGTAGVDLLELAKQWADNEIHVYQFDNEARKIIKAVLRRAHGIKGGA